MNEDSKIPWVVIVGAGFGGMSVAAALDRFIEENPKQLQVILLEKNHSLLLPNAHQFMLNARSRPEQVANAYVDVNFKNVYFVQDEMLSIDTERRVVIARGHRFPYNYLVLATGAQSAPERVSNLAQGAYDIGNVTQVMQLKDAVADFHGGKILVMASENGSGPTSPIEFACLIRSMISSKQSAANQQANITLTIPGRNIWPIEADGDIKTILAERKIDLLTDYQPHYVDTAQRAVIFKNGQKIRYDVLVSQSPLKPPPALVQSNFCTAESFVQVDPLTLRTQIPNVYCIGDCADLVIPNTTRKLPRLGVFAIHQGETVAEDIIKSLQGDDSEWHPQSGNRQNAEITYNMEVGNNQAIKLRFNYYTEHNNEPPVVVQAPDKMSMKDLINWWDGLITKWFTQ